MFHLKSQWFLKRSTIYLRNINVHACYKAEMWISVIRRLKEIVDYIMWYWLYVTWLLHNLPENVLRISHTSKLMILPINFILKGALIAKLVTGKSIPGSWKMKEIVFFTMKVSFALTYQISDKISKYFQENLETLKVALEYSKPFCRY